MPHLHMYVGLLHHAEPLLADSFRTVGNGHQDDAEIRLGCLALARISDHHAGLIGPVASRFGDEGRGDDVEEPERLRADGVTEVRTGPVGVLRDLQDLHLLVTLVQTTWLVVEQAAQGLRDRELMDAAATALRGNARQARWITTVLKTSAPQTLLVAR